ncbi:Heat shock 70 kDa protein 12B [Leucoagaricus sp. SymC.cos]|nr:Heat shock 70 kDa protein 12B [Leucoagaricus sp. SymC.cos]
MRVPYAGKERKLVFAFDVGTTYSGISYAILDPGRKPDIKPVTRFPNRVKVGGDTKVPSVIYYGPDGSLRAIGAETERGGLDIIADDLRWVKAEWFKLHLRPQTTSSASVSDEIPPLPPGKTSIDVFADFLGYLNNCARTYIRETHVDGNSLLASGKVEFILSHPNVWEGAQQTLMRNAAVRAGLISSAHSDRDRISFVSEGEASLNLCIDKGLTNESIRVRLILIPRYRTHCRPQRGEGVTIVDAGGGTIDLSTYALKRDSTTEYEETAPSQSYFRGSIFVTRAAAKYLKDLLQNTRFREDVQAMTEKFDQSTKLAFRDPTDPQFIKFGSVRDRDPELGIRAGQLRLDGHIIAGFFEASVQSIVDAVKEQRRLSTKPVSTIFLVGGFSASDYLFSQVQERLETMDCSVRRPDAHLNKVVPDGALVGYLRPIVHSRVAKYSFGIKLKKIYNPAIPEHLERSKDCIQCLDGEVRIPGGFELLLKKGTSVTETAEFRTHVCEEDKMRSNMRKQNTTPIIVYKGGSSPEFVDQEPKKFHEVFVIQADLTRLIDRLKIRTGKTGGHYFKFNYDIVILFGATEFKAQYAWYEDVLFCSLAKSPSRFPSRAKVGGDTKVPTVVYYGPDGFPRAIGAETEREGIETIAEDSGWVKAEWFKLHLRPQTRSTAAVTDEIPPLPAGKTAVDVFADFLKYLNNCARSYIEETHVDGSSLLASGKVEFILSHPNAWEGAQQTLMRNAAVQAGLISNAPSDRNRVSFVSEGEASLNLCIDKDLTNESIRRGEGVTIVDAGGGTLDVSTYARKRGSSTEYEETAPSQSYFKGSIFVTRAAARYLKTIDALVELLQNTRFRDDVQAMTTKFDQSTKLSFRDPNDPQFIKFGSVRDRDPELNIRAGQLRLDGNIIAGFFEASIQCMVDAVTEQRRLSTNPVSTVFLVGGFAASDYLFSQVQERLQALDYSVHRPDVHLNKVVPDGALVGYLRPTVYSRVAKYSYGIRANKFYNPTKPEHLKRSDRCIQNKVVPDGALVGYLRPTVYSRVAKYSYGIRANKFYNPTKPEHLKRSDRCIQFLNGNFGLPNSFSLLLKKGTQVSETEEFRKAFFEEGTKKKRLRKQNKTIITVYRGNSSPPEFIDQEPENFREVFVIKADLSRIVNRLQQVTGENGKRYFKLIYDIIILFGATEFKAQYAWYEDVRPLILLHVDKMS